MIRNWNKTGSKPRSNLCCWSKPSLMLKILFYMLTYCIKRGQDFLDIQYVDRVPVAARRAGLLPSCPLRPAGKLSIQPISVHAHHIVLKFQLRFYTTFLLSSGVWIRNSRVSDYNLWVEYFQFTQPFEALNYSTYVLYVLKCCISFSSIGTIFLIGVKS